MTRHVRTLAVVSAGALLLAACGDGADGGAETELTVVGTDSLTFDPDELTVPAGEEITIEFTAEGVEHDLVVEGAADAGRATDDDHAEMDTDEDMDDDADEDMDEDTEEADDHAEGENDLHVVHADAGETVTTTFEMDQPDTYEICCSVPGHRDAGMVGTLEVTGSE